GGTRTWSSGRVGWHAPQLVEGGIGSIGCLPAGTDPVEWAVHRLIAWCIAPLRGSIDEIEDCPRPAREACRSGDMVTAAAEIELRGCADRFGMRTRNAPTGSRSATSQLDACQRHVRHGGRNAVTVGAARQPKPIKTARASLGSDLQRDTKGNDVIYHPYLRADLLGHGAGTRSWIEDRQVWNCPRGSRDPRRRRGDTAQ